MQSLARHHDDEIEIERIRARLVSLENERSELKALLVQIEERRNGISLNFGAPDTSSNIHTVSSTSSTTEKIRLFRNLFLGRTDVFPLRWENIKTKKAGYSPACANEWVRGICKKPQIKCGDCAHQAFIPVSDDVIYKHLHGQDGQREFVAGVYPMLQDETCCFLAVDFDKESWVADATAMIETCHAKDIPVALERSRSGNGAHLWFFFSEPVPVRIARQLGTSLMTETIEKRPEIGFQSYDRFFPSQDTMPVGGFGNLIALPLQGKARKNGNSIFIDETLMPYHDQWSYLSSIRRLSSDQVFKLVADAEKHGRVLSVRMPVEDEHADEPWRLSPSRQSETKKIIATFPEKVNIVIADQIYIERSNLSPAIITKFMRLAAFQNPEFYRAQSMRFPTFDKPRIVSCAELHPHHIGLPRGCLDECLELIQAHGAEIVLDDLRNTGVLLPPNSYFKGQLNDLQIKAFDTLKSHDTGVLAATTAFGKTVLAAALIAKRSCNTLVLVHRRELLKQWVERLKTFINIDPKHIGIIGNGRHKPTGIIDVALIQSLVRGGSVSDLVANYGHLVCDECHHLSAASFELVARRSKARHVLGLSATVARKDGHHPIIFMQCGPVRYRVDARTQSTKQGISYRAEQRRTNFQLPSPLITPERPTMPSIYAALAQDKSRNDQIFDDVLKALEAKRSPLVLTERKDHLDYLQKRFAPFVKNLVVLKGGMSAAERKLSDLALNVSNDDECLVIATGRYIGEGFDYPRLDTLFLTMPISWKGTLAQYVGRLHRQHTNKTEVLVIDYVDEAVSTLVRMAAKRRSGYRALGYTIG